MVAAGGFGTVAGAVYKPMLLIVPAVAVQVTLVLLVPATVAVNCTEEDVIAFTLAGESVTTTGFVVVELDPPLPPQPAIPNTSRRLATTSHRRWQVFEI
jgi:hypothetical protein